MPEAERIASSQGYIEDGMTMLHLPNGLRFSWLDLGVRIIVTSLHQHSDKRITGELDVARYLDNEPVKTQRLHSAMFNFTSTTTRGQLIKALRKRYDIDWEEIMEQMCTSVREWVRTGEPVVELETTSTFAPPSYLLYPLILQDEPNVIFGDGESGKSLLALWLTLMVQLPLVDNDFGFTTLQKPTQVLYLDWETQDNTTGWRYKCLSNGLGLPPMTLQYRRCSRTIASDIEAISNIISEHGAKCIVIDSVGMAAGGDINKVEPADEFYKTLRKLKVTSILLGHTSKTRAEGDSKTLYGNAFFTNYARMVWMAQRASVVDSDDISVVLSHKKSNFTKRHPPLGFKFRFDNVNPENARIYVTKENVSLNDILPPDYSVKGKVIECLKQGKMTAGEIARAIGSQRGTVDTTLSRMKDNKEVVKLENHQWGLMSRMV